MQQSEDCELDGLSTTCHATYRSDISGVTAPPGSGETFAARHAWPVRDEVASTRLPTTLARVTNSRRAPGKAVTRRPGKPKKSWGQRVRRALLWVAALGLAGAVIAVGAFIFLYQTIDVPDANAEFKTQTTFVYYDNGKTELGTYARQNRVAVPLDEMPEHLQDAVVSAENKTFWTDSGLDPKGILRAAFSNAKAGQTVGGGSTITQQYVKILYLTSERSLTRKVKEAILSLKIQREMSKREILEGYLNTIYFGRGAYGVQAASQAYFQKDVQDINLRQAAVLASVLNSPNALDPANGDDAKAELKERYDYTLNRMEVDGHATADKVARAKEKLPTFPKSKARSTYGGQRGHMLKLVRDDLVRMGYTDEQIDGGGLRVTTTLNRGLMKSLEESVLEQKPDGFSDEDLHIGAAAVEPGSGELKAFYGGQNYLDSQINWAATGGMAGSTMKAFTVATALQEGFSLRDSFQGNSPFVFPGGQKVYNAGEGASDMGRYVSLLTATAKSTNTAFVDVSHQMDDGPEKIYETMLDAGLTPEKARSEYPGIPSRSVDLTPEDALITLGKARVSPINMANAYATFANEGVRSDVHVVTKVVEPDGSTKVREVNTRRAIDEDVSADTVQALQEVVRTGSGSKARALGRPAAGKTGTATAGVNRENVHVSSSWFVGFTPQLSTAVMYVRGDGDDKLDDWLPSFYGGSYPAATWTAIMRRAMDGVPVESFPKAVWMDGDAGVKRNWTPAPEPKPSKSPSKKPSKKPTPTPTPTPTPVDPTPVEPTLPPETPVPETTPPAPVPTPTPPGQVVQPGSVPAPAPRGEGR